MSVSVVPIIYDKATKAVKRWALLDFEYQLADPAFGPNDDSEGCIPIPMEVFQSFRTDPDTGYHALYDIQAYVMANTS